MQLGGERGDIYRSCDRYFSHPETLFRYQTTEGVLFGSIQRRQREMHSPRSGAFLRTATPSSLWRESWYHRRSSLLRRSTRKGRVPSAEPLSFIPSSRGRELSHATRTGMRRSRFPCCVSDREPSCLGKLSAPSAVARTGRGKKSFVSSQELFATAGSCSVSMEKGRRQLTTKLRPLRTESPRPSPSPY